VLMRRVARALDEADSRGEPYDLSSLRRIHNSGAMVSAPVKDALLSRGTMHVYDSLGSSEAVGFGVALTTGPGQGETACFRLGPNARLLVAADRDDDVIPGSGDVGVLAVHTSCAIGYYKDPKRSAATFRIIDGKLHAIPGDQATLDVDGTLTLLGRGSNCINSGGEKVWPEEVEEVLKEHPAVTDAVVLGVPDDEWGELVAAVVATAGDDPPDADALGDWVGARLAGYKRPRRFVFADEVGRNTVGKLDYEWARAALSL
jgi:3-oxocholest-4-en-26-oate---CoA ligase